MANFNPIEIGRFLRGLSFPIEKENLIQGVKENGAGEHIVKMLEQLPPETYHRPVDVTRALSEKNV